MWNSAYLSFTVVQKLSPANPGSRPSLQDWWLFHQNTSCEKTGWVSLPMIVTRKMEKYSAKSLRSNENIMKSIIICSAMDASSFPLSQVIKPLTKWDCWMLSWMAVNHGPVTWGVVHAALCFKFVANDLCGGHTTKCHTQKAGSQWSIRATQYISI